MYLPDLGNGDMSGYDETTGDLEIKIQADSVDTGSGMKNRKLKGKDFFDLSTVR
jgi:polyisoprenoid-binding protein YceI